MYKSVCFYCFMGLCARVRSVRSPHLTEEEKQFELFADRSSDSEDDFDTLHVECFDPQHPPTVSALPLLLSDESAAGGRGDEDGTQLSSLPWVSVPAHKHSEAVIEKVGSCFSFSFSSSFSFSFSFSCCMCACVCMCLYVCVRVRVCA